MAIIIAPPDNRRSNIGTAIAQALASGLQVTDTRNRVAQIQQGLASGQNDPAQLTALAGDNPEAQQFVKQLAAAMAQKQEQQVQQEQIKHLQAQESLESVQAAVESHRADLVDAETTARRAEAQGDIARARESNARADQIRNEMNIQNFFADLVRKQTQPDTTTEPDTGPPAAAGPTEGATKPSPTFSGTTQPENQDMLALGLQKVKRVQAQQDALGGFTPGISMGGMRMTMQHSQVSDREQASLNDALNLAQTLKQMQDLIVADKNGKLKLGPITGPMQELVNKFKNTPDAMNDPNVMFQILTGHATLSTFSGFGSGALRSGYQMTRLIQNILANMRDGKAYDLQAIKQSMRLLRNMTGQAAITLANKRAVGLNPDLFAEVDRITHEAIDYDPSAQSAAAPGGGGRAAIPAQQKKQYEVGDIVRGADGKQYRVTGGDPRDPDVEEVTTSSGDRAGIPGADQ